jgi:hypothetical protein
MVGLAPPLVGVAVKVALSPLHKADEAVVERAILAEGALMIVT